MASLARMVMEGTSFLGKSDLKHHYDHESGAGLIAMESAEALRDIFECTVHKTSECDIRATMEGASDVWSSTQASVMEGIFANAFEKIKQFFIKLKDKVKEFLHNVKRYLLGVFGNDEKWVKTYEKELKAIPTSDLKDYKIKMYDYRKDLDDIPSKDSVSLIVSNLISSVDNAIEGKLGNGEDKLQEEADKAYETVVNEVVSKKIDVDDLDKELWSYMRNGANDESDKDDVEVSSIMSSAISKLKSASKATSSMDKLITTTDKCYNDAIKETDKARSSQEKLESTAANDDSKKKISEVVTYLRILSSTISKMQTAHNKALNAWKTALLERNAAYKTALTGAFGYARKHKGGK